MKILLAEDEAINRLYINGILEKRGWNVESARSGTEAIELFRIGGFDLILMDITMPDMDGIEAARLIRKQEQGSGKHVPIIAMTAHTRNEDRERFLKAGMDDYIAKPFEAFELHRMIEQYKS